MNSSDTGSKVHWTLIVRTVVVLQHTGYVDSLVADASRNVGATPMEVDGAAGKGAAAKGRNWFVDMPVYEFRENMEVKPTVVNGEVADWDAAEKIYEQALRTRLQADTIQHPLLLVEQSFAASEQRSKMCEMMFEKFEVREHCHHYQQH